MTFNTLAKTLAFSAVLAAVPGLAAAQNYPARPISIIVPCHRVQGANGMLTGFSSGLHRKASLLDFERRVHLTGTGDIQASMPAQLDLF